MYYKMYKKSNSFTIAFFQNSKIFLFCLFILYKIIKLIIYCIKSGNFLYPLSIYWEIIEFDKFKLIYFTHSVLKMLIMTVKTVIWYHSCENNWLQSNLVYFYSLTCQVNKKSKLIAFIWSCLPNREIFYCAGKTRQLFSYFYFWLVGFTPSCTYKILFTLLI